MRQMATIRSESEEDRQIPEMDTGLAVGYNRQQVTSAGYHQKIMANGAKWVRNKRPWSEHAQNAQRGWFNNLQRHPELPPALVLPQHSTNWINKKRRVTWVGSDSQTSRTNAKVKAAGGPTPRWADCWRENNPGIAEIMDKKSGACVVLF